MIPHAAKYRTHLLRVPDSVIIPTWRAQTWCGLAIPGSHWSRTLSEVDCQRCRQLEAEAKAKEAARAAAPAGPPGHAK